jgi:hypothetical protein
VADLEVINVAIAAGQSLSAPVGIGFKVVVGFSIPTGWITAPLTFQITRDGVNFQEYVDGTAAANPAGAVQIPPGATSTLAANTDVYVATGTFDGVNWLKLRSGTSGTPVAQTGGATVGVIVRTVAF